MDDDGELNIDAAVSEIAEGLGFAAEEGEEEKKVEDDGLGNEETVTEEVAAAPAAAATPPKEGEEAATAAAPAADSQLAVPPRTWRPEAGALWAQIPEAARAEILKREEDMFKGLETYKGDANLGRGVKQAIGKYLPILEQHRIDPIQQISGLMDAHYTLATGTAEQKSLLFQRLARDYGIDLASAAVAQPPYRDPEVERLQKELDSVKSTLTAEQEAKQAEARKAFESEVNKFAADPKNVYFQELANDMAELLEKRVAGTIAEAYDKAMKLNPIVAAKEQQRVAAEAAKKAAEEAAKKTEAAKRATAANVRSSARAGSAAAPLGSIDDTLESAYREIMSRGR